jgi:hypothetical protein
VVEKRERPAVAGAAATACGAALAHDPDAYTQAFARRPRSELPSDPEAVPPELPVMLDTNFYILRLQNRLPAAILAFVERRAVLHCAVALAELSISAGILDPGHPGTERHRGPVLRLLESISLSDCRSPGPAAWAEAGMLSGILARTQLGLAKPKKDLPPAEECCQRGRRRELLNDVLLFLTARENGAVLVSSNAADMDLLLRFRPDARILLYGHAAPSGAAR